MITNMPIVTCDISGCRSTCSLTAADAADIPKALADRGWKVVAGEKDKHLCPGCVSFRRDRGLAAPNLNG